MRSRICLHLYVCECVMYSTIIISEFVTKITAFSRNLFSWSSLSYTDHHWVQKMNFLSLTSSCIDFHLHHINYNTEGYYSICRWKRSSKWAGSLARCLSCEFMFAEEICTSTLKLVTSDNFMSSVSLLLSFELLKPFSPLKVLRSSFSPRHNTVYLKIKDQLQNEIFTSLVSPPRVSPLLSPSSGYSMNKAWTQRESSPERVKASFSQHLHPLTKKIDCYVTLHELQPFSTVKQDFFLQLPRHNHQQHVGLWCRKWW